MLRFEPSAAPTSTVTVQQSRLRRPWGFGAKLEALDGFCFAKTMRAVASKNGFGAGLGDARRTIILCAWSNRELAERYLVSDVGRQAGSDWSALLEVLGTRGSHRGLAPLAGTGSPAGSGQVAVLTLGTTRRRSLARFMAHGVRLRDDLERSPGLRFATSAGWPTKGNSTFSVWRSESEMLEFAYRGGSGHADTARAKPPILVEQLNARMRVLATAGDAPFSP